MQNKQAKWEYLFWILGDAGEQGSAGLSGIAVYCLINIVKDDKY